MVQGMAVLKWDDTIGPKIIFKYPYHFDIPDDTITKLYLSVSIKNHPSSFATVSIEIDEKLYLAYGYWEKGSSRCYDIILMILHAKESLLMEEIRAKLEIFGKKVFELPERDRFGFIVSNFEKFFRKRIEKKIILMGRAGTGKTSMKRVVFDGEDPASMVSRSITPTTGIETRVASWLEITLGIFDTSGQEIGSYINDREDYQLLFQDASIVVYMLDFPGWISSHDEIIYEISRLKGMLSKVAPGANLVLFFHKVDLVNKLLRDEELARIEREIKERLSLPVYFTSIHPGEVYRTYQAISRLVAMISEDTRRIQEIVAKTLENVSKTAVIIFNADDGVVVQEISTDFDGTMLNHVQGLTIQSIHRFRLMSPSDNVRNFLIQGIKGTMVHALYLNLPEHGLGYCTLVTTKLDEKRTCELAQQIKEEITSYFQSYPRLVMDDGQ